MSVRLLLFGLTVTLLVTGCAGRRVTTFSDMEKRVPAGATVYVETRDGTEVKGKLAAVSGPSMTVSLRDASTRQFSEADVTRVRMKDTLWNGTLIGAAIGAAPAVLLIDQGCTAPLAVPDCKTVSREASVAIFAGMGAGFGLLWDALHRQRVFHGARPGRRAAVVIVPVVSPTAAGVRVLSRF